MASHPPLLTAVSSSARQLLLLLRCISFSKKSRVRISAEGIRFSTEEGSIMEAFVFLEKSLFTSYTYNAPPPLSSQEDVPAPPYLEINLTALLETLNIFGLSDPASAMGKRGGEYDSFATHRLNRHNAFSTHALGMPAGICTFSYAGSGSPLSIHMSESGVTTTCDLTTYEASTTEEIPFNRDSLALKTIMRASSLLDTVTELSSMNPETITITATPGSAASNNISFTSTGSLGSATVDFTTNTPLSTTAPILETFQCPRKTSASFKFGLVKAAQRAMASATKVSLRLDGEGVLSLQFLVELVEGKEEGEGVAFVDFRVVPLFEGEDGEGHGEGNGGSSDEE
ncbi:checkpoint clamp complex protein Rad1 [Vermiconidia calcicola]|uniref:Checkpoint clamp complex protein Rad1 n=1 Tax=Vermiconidia calcicola TaxID=1690605 RepID=A0ACC3N6F5_9PEZI|nr:checkpoint clamp complex protein Rad1 [Vermiconidia calcicola]